MHAQLFSPGGCKAVLYTTRARDYCTFHVPQLYESLHLLTFWMGPPEQTFYMSHHFLGYQQSNKNICLVLDRGKVTGKGTKLPLE